MEIINLVAAKKSVRPSEGMAEGGCGGNSALPSQKIEASPAALLVESRTQQKSFLFHLEEKIRRGKNQQCRENFFAGLRVVASGGGLASLVGVLRKMGSDFFKQTPPKNFKVATSQNKTRLTRVLFLCVYLTSILFLHLPTNR